MSGTLEQNVFKLSALMRAQPELSDLNLLEMGHRCLDVHNDSGPTELDEERREALRELYMITIADLSNGAPRLRDHTLGLSIREGRLELFSAPENEAHDVGQIVCRIEVRPDFKKRLERNVGDLVQSEINASIYFLTDRISKLDP